MRTIPRGQWGKAKKRASRKEITISSFVNSTFTMMPGFDSDGALESLIIEFAGDLARIPNLKNRKIPGKVFTNPEVEGRLYAMDEHFNLVASSSENKLCFEDEEVFLLLICGNRPRDFDVDSCMVTIRDWLEPKTKVVGKKVRARGWGVGVVNDDHQIRGIALKWADVGVDYGGTFIKLMRRSDVMPHVRLLLNQLSDTCLSNSTEIKNEGEI